MDLLFVVGDSCQWDNYEEFRYSLRSWQTFYKDLKRVFVVGNRPDWLIGVQHIKVKDTSGPAANIIQKILLACDSNISDDFIYSADDYFLLKESKLEDFWKVGTVGNFKTPHPDKDNPYVSLLNSNFEILKRHGYSSFLNCENHCPRVINKHKYKRVMSSLPWKGSMLTPFNAYFNSYTHNRFLLGNPLCVMLKHTWNKETLNSRLKGKNYASINSGAMSVVIKEFLSERFSIPTEFEANLHSMRKRVIKKPIIKLPHYKDCGIMMIGFGYSYEGIGVALAESIRHFSNIPIELHTNLPKDLLNPGWKNITNLKVTTHDMRDEDNRVVKTQLSKYTSFKRTLYIDVDSRVVSGQFIELFDMLSNCDIVFPEWLPFSRQNIDIRAKVSFKFRMFQKIYKKFGIQDEYLVSGGICCFNKCKKVDEFFNDFFELWKYTERKQDMPGLNGSLFKHHIELNYRFIRKNRYNNSNSSVIVSLHNSLDKRLGKDFTRQRLNPSNGQLEYVKQGSRTFFTKPKVAMIYDHVGWAFYHQSNSLKKRLSDEFIFDPIHRDAPFDESYYDVIITWSISTYNSLKHKEKVLVGSSSHNPKSIGILSSLKYSFTNDLNIFHALSSEKKYYVPNGVETELFKSDREIGDIKTIATVGSEYRAGHKGKFRLREIAKQVGLKDISLFVDSRNSPKTPEQMVEYYKGVDLLIISSESETGPLPMMEAMSMGIPVISNPVGLAPRIILHGMNGFLTKNHEDIQSYVGFVRFLQQNPGLKNHISKEARTSIRAYDWDLMAENYRIMIKDFLNG